MVFVKSCCLFSLDVSSSCENDSVSEVIDDSNLVETLAPKKRGRKKMVAPETVVVETVMAETKAEVKAIQEEVKTESPKMPEEDEAIELAPNQALVTLSYSLMSQAKQLSRFEGVSLEDMIIELLAEGIARRGFEDSQRQAPSHLMTRTGYVPPEAMPQNSQPSMSHHMGYGNMGNVANGNQRNGNRAGSFNQNGQRSFGQRHNGAQGQNRGNSFGNRNGGLNRNRNGYQGNG